MLPCKLFIWAALRHILEGHFSKPGFTMYSHNVLKLHVICEGDLSQSYFFVLQGTFSPLILISARLYYNINNIVQHQQLYNIDNSAY